MKKTAEAQTARAFRAVVRGRVQGVGFRYFTLRAARSLGITGRVRNMPDGTVEVEAAGTERAMGDFLAELNRGPSFSRVTSVDVEWLDAVPEYGDFDVGY